MKFELYPLVSGYWESIRDIYQSGIITGQATFETKLPSKKDFFKRFECDESFVAIYNKEIVGWVGLSKVSLRSCYSGVREVSVYVDEKYRGKGIGNFLLKSCIMNSENVGIWTLQSRIFPENNATVQLHLKHGFKIIGERERIAQLNGVWRNALDLERRRKN